MSKIKDEIINKYSPVIDLYWEHSQHKLFEDKCSECYSEKKQIDLEDMMVGVSYNELEN
jgi:hypothetical protein